MTATTEEQEPGRVELDLADILAATRQQLTDAHAREASLQAYVAKLQRTVAQLVEHGTGLEAKLAERTDVLAGLELRLAGLEGDKGQPAATPPRKRAPRKRPAPARRT